MRICTSRVFLYITIIIQQAGGCCHTFIDKGYEFDVGIHYIGEMTYQSLTKTYVDQITNGQLEWAQLSKLFYVML